MSADRRIVLKPLDDDCLLEGELHPNIRMRLERVRELPVKGVANLHGAERIGSHPFLVWEHVPGQTLEAFAKEALADEVAAQLRELELVVEAMHLAGIVHGAIHERNVIIDDAGGVHLTHVCPLLINDPAIDLAAMAAMRSRVLKGLGPIGVANFPVSRPAEDESHLRLRSLVAAALVAAMGLGIFFGVRHWIGPVTEDQPAVSQVARP